MNARRLHALLMAGFLVAGVAAAQETRLPQTAPTPTEAPEEEREQELPAAPAETPTPDEKPESSEGAADAAKPEDAPSPDAAGKPEDASKPSEAQGPEADVKPARPAPPPRDHPSASEEAACRVRLKALGAKFEDRPAEKDASGCDLPSPVAVFSLGPGVEIDAPILVNCATAEAAARFVQTEVAPVAVETFGSSLVSIRQDSGYVCRPRNGTSTLSEHAFGNAIDFGSFRLADGRDIAVEATQDSVTAGFLDRVRKAACGPFKTVLGPGTDADHATHFHFDLAQRRNGSTYCR